MYNERTDDWEALRDGVEISSKKPIQSVIAQIPSAGYTHKDNFSKASIQWLEYQMELARRDGQSLQIKHALNGGEAKILCNRYRADGLAGNVIYEFHGKCLSILCI